MREERIGVDLGGWGRGKDLGGDERRETIINILYGKLFSTSYICIIVKHIFFLK